MTNEIIEAFMNTLKYQTIEDVEVAVIDNQLKKITLKIEDGPIIHIEPNENNSLDTYWNNRSDITIVGRTINGYKQALNDKGEVSYYKLTLDDGTTVTVIGIDEASIKIITERNS